MVGEVRPTKTHRSGVLGQSRVLSTRVSNEFINESLILFHGKVIGLPSSYST